MKYEIVLDSREEKAIHLLSKLSGLQENVLVTTLFRKHLQTEITELANVYLERVEKLDRLDKIQSDLLEVEKEEMSEIAEKRKNCKHYRVETFEDGAMYRCVTCGATGITGSGRDPI